jgi:hypothetical protein
MYASKSAAVLDSLSADRVEDFTQQC